MDYYLIPRRLLAVSGMDGMNVILGNTRETVRRNILIPMQNLYGVRRVGNIRSDNSCMMFGEKVFVLGADNANHVDRIRGMSIKYCYGDEITTWNQDVFDMLKSRLDKSYSRFDGTCNPAGPQHWAKIFLDSEADIYQQSYTIDDNPFLPEEFVENLKREYAGTVYYDRYILGLWALAEGLIYPNYADALCDIPEDPPSEYCLSIDYGTKNPFAALLWGKRGSVWYLEREYYYSGRESGRDKTDGDYLNDLLSFIPDTERTIETIIDPSAASFIALLRRAGRFRVRKADNAVLDGIRETATAMQRELIKVNRGCKHTVEEFQSYVWDEDSVEDRPIKENDHAMDALRYFCKTKHIVRPKNDYIPLSMR
jgi:PBSX family phage terminase large subunit